MLLLLAFEQIFVKQLYSSNASLLKAKIIIRLYTYVPHLSVACSRRRLTTPHIRVQRSYRTVTHRRRIPVVTANMVRSPSPRQRREGTSINEAVRFRRVSINIPHTCFERAAILQRLPTVSTSQSGAREHAFVKYTMNPQSTDARVVESKTQHTMPRRLTYSFVEWYTMNYAIQQTHVRVRQETRESGES